MGQEPSITEADHYRQRVRAGRGPVGALVPQAEHGAAETALPQSGPLRARLAPRPPGPHRGRGCRSRSCSSRSGTRPLPRSTRRSSASCRPPPCSPAQSSSPPPAGSHRAPRRPEAAAAAIFAAGTARAEPAGRSNSAIFTALPHADRRTPPSLVRAAALPQRRGSRHRPRPASPPLTGGDFPLRRRAVAAAVALLPAAVLHHGAAHGGPVPPGAPPRPPQRYRQSLSAFYHRNQLKVPRCLNKNKFNITIYTDKILIEEYIFKYLSLRHLEGEKRRKY